MISGESSKSSSRSWLGDIQQLDLDVFAKIGALDQQLQAFPRRFQRLEFGVMQDLIDLLAELGIDLGDHPVDQAFFHRLAAVVRLDQFFDKRRDTALGNAIGLVHRRSAVSAR